MTDNERERLYKLKKIVEDFKMVLSGTDQISGGFPTIPEHHSDEQLLNHLEMVHEKFSISGGPDAQVEGSLKTGVSVNMKCPEGAAEVGGVILPTPPPPEPAECPTDETVCVTFSGITSCGCVSENLKGFILDDSALNGSFELNLVFITGGIVQWEGTGSGFHLEQYASTGCLGDPEEECDNIPASIILQCVDHGGGVFTHTINYYVLSFDVCASGWGGVDLQLFRGDYSGTLVYGTPEVNELPCGESGTGKALANGGTMTVVSGGC